MNMILIGNMVSLAGCIAMIMTGFLKKRKSIISLQCLQFALMGIGNVILGGISGALSNVLGIVRNLFSMKVKDFNLAWKLTFIALQGSADCPGEQGRSCRLASRACNSSLHHGDGRG